MEVSLKDFISGGPFGPVDVGMIRSKVQDAFGVPVDWEDEAPTYKKANIWKYGDVEFYFQDDKLWMIFISEFEVPDGGDQIELDAWGLTGQFTRAEAEAKLKAANIEYHTEPFPYNDSGIHLVTKAKTVLAFSGRAGEEATLRAIHRRVKL